MNVIGIGGYARCGKDTFVNIAKEILKKNGYVPMRVAFADKLKEEVDKMLKGNNFPIDVYSNDTVMKKKIRPLLVWWGCQRRDDSENGLYWVNEVDKYMSTIPFASSHNYVSMDKVVILVSDVRFRNEADWIHEKWQGNIIHIRRWSMQDVRDGYGDMISSKVFDDAPNEEEAKNDPLIRSAADVQIEWESRSIPAGGDVLNDDYLRGQVWNALNSTKFFKHKTTGILSL